MHANCKQQILELIDDQKKIHNFASFMAERQGDERHKIILDAIAKEVTELLDSLRTKVEAL